MRVLQPRTKYRRLLVGVLVNGELALLFPARCEWAHDGMAAAAFTSATRYLDFQVKGQVGSVLSLGRGHIGLCD